MAAAVLCAAQYTALDAVTVTPTGEVSRHHGAGPTGPALIVPVAASLLMMVLTVAFNLYVTPVRDVRDAPARRSVREAPRFVPSDGVYGAERVTDGRSALRTDDRGTVEAGPGVRVAG